jgi:hypothetical protein
LPTQQCREGERKMEGERRREGERRFAKVDKE